MNPYALAGAFLCAVAAACCIPSWLTRLDQWRADRRLVKARMTRIDALIESALRQGPAPDAEVQRRIRAHMDAACTELRGELETPQNWSA